MSRSRIVSFFMEWKNETLGVVMALAGGAALIPNTLAIKYYKKLYAKHQDGLEQRLQPEVADLIQNVLNEILMDPAHEAGLDFFVTSTPDPVHKGSAKMSSGAVIGYPATLGFSSVEDIDKETLLINDSLPNWSSSTGQKLLNSLILSDKAKRFAVAREIQYTCTYHAYLPAFLVPSTIYATYLTSLAINGSLGYIMKPWGRGILIAGMGMFYLLIYRAVIAAYQMRRDRKVDQTTAEMGIDYAVGGVEYYNNVIQRNIALRAFMGKQGAKYYTPFGNQVTSWVTPKQPLIARRDDMIKMVEIAKQIKEEEEQNTKEEQQNTAAVAS